jgi:CheY-like chemotaxis protein
MAACVWRVREEVDVVLMDLQMPEMDGFQAAAAIRRSEQLHGGRVPIVALTTHALIGDRENCISSGMDGTLPSLTAWKT